MYIYVYNVWHIKCVMMIHSILDRIVHAKVVCVCVCVCVERVKNCSIFELSRTTIFCSIYLFFSKVFFQLTLFYPDEKCTYGNTQHIYPLFS